MEFGKRTKKIAMAYSLSVEELAYADLVACGWEVNDAYRMAFRLGETWTEDAVRREARVVSANSSVKKRIREVRKGELNDAALKATSGNTETPEEDEKSLLEEVSKEQMLKDLVKARRSLKSGTKEWNEMNKLIVEITRMKHEELKTEDNTVHYYLPLTCNKCSLYKKTKTSKSKK